MEYEREQKLAAERAQLKQAQESIGGIASTGQWSPAEQNFAKTYSEKPRAILLRQIQEAEEIYIRRLAALVAAKDEVNRASDRELELLHKFQAFIAEATLQK